MYVNFPFVSGQDRIDMPQINYDMFNGKKYKYFYGTGLFINQHFMNSVSALPWCIPYRMNIYMELNLATWLRLVKFTALIINKFQFFEFQSYKLSLRDSLKC